jgi:hypothetical protein
MEIHSPDIPTSLKATPERIAELDRLGDEIAELSAHLEAATARLLDLIRAFDARGGWGNGFRSCAHWLSWRIGLDLGAAREKVRVARALGTLPLLAEAFAYPAPYTAGNLGRNTFRSPWTFWPQTSLAKQWVLKENLRFTMREVQSITYASPANLEKLSDTARVELMRLQTFPDGYKVTGTLSEVHRQIGNAVPCALAETLALEIRRQLLDDRVTSKNSALVPSKRLRAPGPEVTQPVPRKYRQLMGIHKPHPGTGMGYAAQRRAA